MGINYVCCYVVLTSVYDPTVKCVSRNNRDAKEEEIFKQCNSSKPIEDVADGIAHVHQIVSWGVSANGGVCLH